MTPEKIAEIISFFKKISGNSKNNTELLYHTSIILNEIFLKYLEEMVLPELFYEFQLSFRSSQKKYIIFDDDLPIIRDLKACLNMLHAIEKGALKMLFSPKEPALSLLNKLEILREAYDFRQNYEIFSATNNILTHYISHAKKFVITTVIPELIEKLLKVSQYITHENLKKMENLFTEQMIGLEKYKENYTQKKTSAIKELDIDKKEEKEDDLITFILKKSDNCIKSIYPEEYFSREIKLEANNSLENFLNYYEINTKDTDTIKNIKLFLNSLIGIKKVLNDHEEYQQAGFLQSVGWMTTFVKDLRRVYQSLFQIDYQAIIAEKSNPFTETMKKQLQKLNGACEKIACILDELEGELHLKEDKGGYLLRHEELLLDSYNQITYELRIPVDYVRQKYMFLSARLASREKKLIEIDLQLEKLHEFMLYKSYALVNIPPDIIEGLKTYIKKYGDDICMNRDRLNIYKEYLDNTLKTKRGLKTFLFSHFEHASNQLGLTIHYELMHTLHSRMLYFQKQQQFLEKRFESTVEYDKKHPFIYFKANDTIEAISPKIEKHIANISAEKDSLCQQSEDLLKNNKTLKLEEFKPRLANLIQLKTKELKFFQSALKKYQETNSLAPLDEKDNLSPQSAVMLSEMQEIMRLSETKSLKGKS